MKDLWKYFVAVPIVIGHTIVETAEEVAETTDGMINKGIEVSKEELKKAKILGQYLFSTKEIELD